MYRSHFGSSDSITSRVLLNVNNMDAHATQIALLQAQIDALQALILAQQARIDNLQTQVNLRHQVPAALVIVDDLVKGQVPDNVLLADRPPIPNKYRVTTPALCHSHVKNSQYPLCTRDAAAHVWANAGPKHRQVCPYCFWWYVGGTDPLAEAHLAAHV